MPQGLDHIPILPVNPIFLSYLPHHLFLLEYCDRIVMTCNRKDPYFQITELKDLTHHNTNGTYELRIHNLHIHNWINVSSFRLLALVLSFIWTTLDHLVLDQPLAKNCAYSIIF